jgi:hypothetical protein
MALARGKFSVMFSQFARPAILGGLGAVAVLAAAAPALAQAQPVTGRNVTEVAFANGRFIMGPMGQWDERGDDSGHFRFSEMNRDDWSVYLFDGSRGVRLQLDLHTRKVMYADASDPAMRPLYEVTGASAVVNGRNASRVWTSATHFRMTGPGQWEERGGDGASFLFSEQGRDDWSVYLFDGSRGVSLQLDLHTRKVMYSDSGAPERRPLYDIIRSGAVDN